MPKCVTCNQFVPSDFCIVVNPTEAVPSHRCKFCEENKESMIIDGVLFTKEFVVNDYREYVAKLARSENIVDKIKECIVQDAVDKYAQ